MTIAGKTVLVTGAGGSIGSVLCERLAKSGVHRLKALSLTEGALCTVTRKLKGLGFAHLEPILGSVSDLGLLNDILDGVDVVIHAAAHKHVPICQENPVEAIRNNVFGTETLLYASIQAGVKSFVLVSTDKAVRPASIMGATKRVAELVVKKAERIQSDTQLTVVRFGNVLDSAGSVLPLWREQIASGGPLTLTDERCERYFMSIPDAVELILGALELGSGTFVFDMGPPHKIADIAERLIRSSGRECEIEYIGLRPGEKLTEELFRGTTEKTEHPKILRVADDLNPYAIVELDELRGAVECRATNEAVRLLGVMTAQ